MEIKLRMKGGTVISSESKARKEANKASTDASSERIEEIRKAASEVRELIEKSNELDVLAKRLDKVGYSDWVKSGDRDRFYQLMEILNSGAETARVYWEDRHNSSPSHRKVGKHPSSTKPKKTNDDGLEP
jgi:hypothetical protein